MATRMTGEQRREQLLDATKAIVVADGFHAVSIEAVARARRDHAADRLRPLRGPRRAAGGARRARVAARAGAAPGDLRRPARRARPRTWRRCATDPDTWRLVLMPQEGAPRLLHERIAAGRAAVDRAARAGAARRARPAGPGAVGAHALRLRRRGRPAHAPGLRRSSGSSSSRAGRWRGCRLSVEAAARALVDDAEPLAEREAQVGRQALRVGAEHRGRDRDDAGAVGQLARELGRVGPDVGVDEVRALRRRDGEARPPASPAQMWSRLACRSAANAAYQPSPSRSAAAPACWNGVAPAKVRNCLAARTAATSGAGPGRPADLPARDAERLAERGDRQRALRHPGRAWPAGRARARRTRGARRPRR